MARQWVGAKDPGFLAAKRSARAAVVVPSVFALTHFAFKNPQVGLFGAFGSFAFLLLVDFPGRTRTRLISYTSLFIVGIGLIAIGTAASTHKVAAVVSMALVGFVVLFVGIVSPQAAVAPTATLLLFVLPVAVAQPVSAIGPRLLGWSLAAAFSIPVSMFVWRTHWHDNLRRHLSDAVSAVSRLAESHALGQWDPEGKAAVDAELEALRKQFASTTYPPTGAAAGAVALTKLVGRVEWVATNAILAKGDMSLELPQVRNVIAAAAQDLGFSAALICGANAYPGDPPLVEKVRASTIHLEQLVEEELDTEVSELIASAPSAPSAPTAPSGRPSAGTDLSRDGDSRPADESGLASSLDPSFSARGLAVATAMLADVALEAAGADPMRNRKFVTPDEGPAPKATWSKLVSHFSFRSVWFRNSVRGAAGLALAVAVVEVTDVEHGFWVVLGTLSVLRSNALGTGSTALRAVGGTAVGFVIGSAIMLGVGSHSVALWVLLPLAVLISGSAASMISFAAGQAGFTLVVIIRFNIIQPVGWKVGLTRIEDVAIGCGVSVVAGVLFWPRGATAALGHALSDAFVASSGYLADAVDRLTTNGHRVAIEPAQRSAHLAYLRLDDAFRQFLAERGAKVVPVDAIANLFTGANRIRLAAFTLASLPDLPLEAGLSELESVDVAGALLRDSYSSSHRWYEEFSELLADRRDSLDSPPVHDATLHHVLRDAFEDARSRGRRDELRLALRMLLVDDLLEAQRKVQVDLLKSADLFVRRGREARILG